MEEANDDMLRITSLSANLLTAKQQRQIVEDLLPNLLAEDRVTIIHHVFAGMSQKHGSLCFAYLTRLMH